MSKVLVAYFSASGVTKKVAEEIAKAEQGSLFEILPEVPYTAADLDWTNKQSRSTLEMQDLGCRPPVVGQVENMAQYDVVFIGLLTKSKGNYNIPTCIVTIGTNSPIFESLSKAHPPKMLIFYIQRNQRSTMKIPVLLKSMKSKVNYHSK